MKWLLLALLAIAGCDGPPKTENGCTKTVLDPGERILTMDARGDTFVTYLDPEKKPTAYKLRFLHVGYCWEVIER